MINYSNPPDSKRRHNSPAITGERYPRNDVKLPSPKTLNCAVSPVFIKLIETCKREYGTKILITLGKIPRGFL